VISNCVGRFSEFALCDQITLASSVRDLLAPGVSMGFLILKWSLSSRKDFLLLYIHDKKSVDVERPCQTFRKRRIAGVNSCEDSTMEGGIYVLST
jgi:hypothetical protein